MHSEFSAAPYVEEVVRAVASAHKAAADRHAECTNYQTLVIEEAHRALAGHDARRSACRQLLVEASRSAEAKCAADTTLVEAVNALALAALRAVREATERQRAMDSMQLEIQSERSRMEANGVLISEERKQQQVERDAAAATEARLHNELARAAKARDDEARAARSRFNSAMEEMQGQWQREMEATLRDGQATRKRLEDELLQMRTQQQQAQWVHSVSERNATERLQRDQREAAATRDAAASCLVREVRMLEAERAELLTALSRRNDYLREMHARLGREHAEETAELAAAHQNEAAMLRKALGIARRNLRLALSGLPSARSEARQALYYESLKSVAPDKVPSMSWRGAKETIAAHQTVAWQTALRESTAVAADG